MGCVRGAVVIMKSAELRKLIPKQLSQEQMIEILIDIYEMCDKLPPKSNYSSISVGNIGIEIDAMHLQERVTLSKISDMILDRVQRPEPMELRAYIEKMDAALRELE